MVLLVHRHSTLLWWTLTPIDNGSMDELAAHRLMHWSALALAGIDEKRQRVSLTAYFSPASVDNYVDNPW
jgi:hypothetical protein